MIKKLFTKLDKQEENQGDDRDFFDTADTAYLLRKNLTSRSIFSYKFKDWWLISKFNSKWCCCCKKSPDKSYKLFNQAKSKLNREIDILKMVKQLRVQ